MQIQNFLHLEGTLKNLVIEEVDAPSDAVLCSEEVRSSQATMFEKEIHVEPAEPTDATTKREKKTDQLDPQRLDEQ